MYTMSLRVKGINTQLILLFVSHGGVIVVELEVEVKGGVKGGVTVEVELEVCMLSAHFRSMLSIGIVIGVGVGIGEEVVVTVLSSNPMPPTQRHRASTHSRRE